MRPRSVTGLLLASFTLVALPLLAATIYSVVYVDRLVDQSERLVLRGVETTVVSQKLDTILTAMERSARQYRIVGDPVLAERFAEHKASLDRTLQVLHELELETMSSWNLDMLARQADTLAAAVQQGPEAIADKLAVFDSMRSAIALITAQGRAFINAQLKNLRETAEAARLFLLLCTFMLIPGVILLSGIFIYVISRPVRQITAAVDRLGSGDFSTPVHVAAPSSEFDALAAQLDRMRQRLATLEDERNQFLRRMSHELKTPLASIREGAELLRDGTVGTMDPTQAEVTDIIRRNSLELLALIENLLDFSAWQQQQAKLEYTHFDLGDLAETVVARQKLSIESKNLTVSVPGKPANLVADRERTCLIVDNLLSNAVKFSPAGGTIDIDAVRGRQSVVLSVTDQGPGIAPAERGHIFEAFYQIADSRGHTHIRGTGIGLSVVNECVHAHRGSIEIADAAGGGTCFRVTLPDSGGTMHA